MSIPSNLPIANAHLNANPTSDDTKNRFEELLEAYSITNNMPRSGEEIESCISSLESAYEKLEAFVEAHPEYKDRLPEKRDFHTCSTENVECKTQ